MCHMSPLHFCPSFFFAFSREISVWNLLHGLLINSLEDRMSNICLDQKLLIIANSVFGRFHPFCYAAPVPSQDEFSQIFFFQSSNCRRPMKLGKLIPYGCDGLVFIQNVLHPEEGGSPIYFSKFQLCANEVGTWILAFQYLLTVA